jgi:murein L,D-transpeptidase YafK
MSLSFLRPASTRIAARLSGARLSSSRIALASASLLMLAGCNAESSRYPARAYAPIPADTLALFQKANTDRAAPVLIRAYKKESEIEVWKQARDGRYALVKTYPICRWSGQLGPKKREGDRQVPEGFYTVNSAQMNPNSAYWLSFNVGYPNTLERAMGRNGGDIMVHGTCSSRGCFAMTNEQIEEIYAVMREALNGGQKVVQFQSYPFRMTAENMAKFRHDPNIAFWKNLKEGSDHFEVTKAEPKIGYCGGKYVFNVASANGRMDPAGACPPLKIEDGVAQAVAAKEQRDEQRVAELVQSGTPAIRVAYSDGGQNASFRNSGYGNAGSEGMVLAATAGAKVANLGDVSRPEALDAVEEYAVNERGERKDPKVQVATAGSAKAAPAALPTAPAAVTVANATPATKELKTAVTLPASATALAPAQQQASTPGALGALGSLFGASQPAQTPVTAASATPEEKPFLKRWLNIGSEDSAAPADATPAAPVPAKVPLPPKRQASAEPRARVALAGANVETAGQ